MSLAFKNYVNYPANELNYRKIVGIVLDGSYPANGWPVTPANLGVTSILDLRLPAICSGYALEWDRTNSKIKVWQDPAGSTAGAFAELSTANALSGKEIICEVLGS